MEKLKQKLERATLEASRQKAAYDMGSHIVEKQRENLRALENMHDKNYQELLKANSSVQDLSEELNKMINEETEKQNTGKN